MLADESIETARVRRLPASWAVALHDGVSTTNVAKEPLVDGRLAVVDVQSKSEEGSFASVSSCKKVKVPPIRLHMWSSPPVEKLISGLASYDCSDIDVDMQPEPEQSQILHIHVEEERHSEPRNEVLIEGSKQMEPPKATVLQELTMQQHVLQSQMSAECARARVSGASVASRFSWCIEQQRPSLGGTGVGADATTPCRLSLAYTASSGESPGASAESVGSAAFYGERPVSVSPLCSPMDSPRRSLDRRSLGRRSLERRSLAVRRRSRSIGIDTVDEAKTGDAHTSSEADDVDGPVAVSAPAAQQPSEAASWVQRYSGEMGRSPRTAEQLCSFARNRGGKVTWVEANRML